MVDRWQKVIQQFGPGMGAALFDREGNVLSWSSFAAAATGIPADQAIGRNVRLLFQSNAAYMPLLRLFDGQENTVVFPVSAAEQPAHVVVGTVLPQEAGRDVGALFLDATLFSDATQGAFSWQRSKIIRTMASGLTQALRGPLATAIGFLQLLARDLKHPYLSEAMREVTLLSNLLDALVDTAIPTSLPTPQPTNIYAILSAALQLSHFQALRSGIAIEVEAEDRDTLVLCDAEQLMRSFHYVIQNALEAMTDGGVLKVRQVSYFNRGWVEVTFQDNGAGMDEQQQSLAGIPFWTTKAGHLGLGIAYATNVVHRYHGDLRFETQPAAGTQVFFKLPIYKG